ncbi:hypothetical protein N7508_002996 [Penicillium antarcticum]|uniref:uncharacterized protein n=1 Tax=Penicillium antarcticum TaxID=416450 RepID=UPI00239A7E52|nr:uncharacterized protein N7508_002996 [Penicillium antarcticum]KAJ5312166.1 hypothetical protein N7508_002996 [Penicillium antarcticum]
MPSDIFLPGVRSKDVRYWSPSHLAHLFLAFCVILIVRVTFFVPETKGVPIEEMDKRFGRNQGQAYLKRIMEIRSRLDIPSAEERDLAKAKRTMPPWKNRSE